MSSDILEAPTQLSLNPSIWEDYMNKEILKCIIKKGEGNETASVSTVCKCNLKGFIKQKHEDSSIQPQFDLVPFEILTDQHFQIGESDAFPALELALRHALVGEIFRVRSTSKFAFGSSERPVLKSHSTSEKPIDTIPFIPANTPLEYEVEVLEHIDSSNYSDPNYNSTSNLVLRDILIRKECGNRWFSYNEYAKAGK